MSVLQEERKCRLSQYGYSMNSFAYNVGIQPTNFGKMMSGTQKITDRTRRMIEARFPDLNFDWLLTGEGEMLRENTPRPIAQQNNPHSPGARMENNYYMHGGAKGGNIAAQNLEVKSASEDARPIIPSYMYSMPDYDIYANIKNGAANMEIFSVEGFMKQIDIIYRVQDNSMTPTFTSGDLIGIRRLPETEHIVNGDYYVIDTKPHGVRLRILIENADSYTLRTTDANRDRYTDFKVAKSEIISIFAVIFLFRHSFV
jgi:phage repressor protein C with HTH and peptisase S24 domain